MVRRLLVLLLAVLAGCARTSPPAPVEFHAGAGSPVSPEPAGPHPDRIVVASGDTLYGIARRYGLPIRAIIDANHLQPPYRVLAGTSLTLPQLQTYKVRAGDTLAVVARRQGVDMSSLAAANHLGPPYVIRTGAILILPSPVETGPAPAPSPPPTATAVENPPPPASGAAAVPPAKPVPPPAQAVAEAAIAPSSEPEAKPAAPRQGEPAKNASAAASPAKMASAPANEAAAEAPAAEPRASTGKMASLPPLPVAGSGLLWPVHGRIVASFGTAADGQHNDGIDIAAPEGTPVLAAEAGEVAYAGNELKGYGNLVLIKHPDGFVTAYAHNAALLVKRGDQVARGQPIARVGATGAVSEPQLHFEIRRGTRALDPIEYLPAEAASK